MRRFVKQTWISIDCKNYTTRSGKITHDSCRVMALTIRTNMITSLELTDINLKQQTGLTFVFFS